MIAEALMLPLLAFHPIINGDAHTSFSKFLNLEHRTLVIGGDPRMVAIFREHDVKAFGALVEDHPYITPWHAVCDAIHLSFRPSAFNAVYYAQNNYFDEQARRALREAINLVREDGFFLFREEEWWAWPAILKSWAWVRVPFTLGDYAVWERRDQSRGSRNGHKELGSSA